MEARLIKTDSSELILSFSISFILAYNIIVTYYKTTQLMLPINVLQ